MTLKNTALALALASLTLWGCGGDDKDTGVGTGTGTGTTTDGSGGGGGGGGGGANDDSGGGGGGGARGFEPNSLGILFAEFGYNADDGEIIGGIIDGEAFDAHIVFYAADDASNFCTTDVSFPTPFAAETDGAWLATHDLFGGFVIPADAVIDSSDCDSQITDPEWLDLMAGGWFMSDFGIGVGTITADSLELATGRTNWGAEQDFALGGGWYWSDLSSGYTWAPDGYLPDGVAFGYVMDEEGNILPNDDGYFDFMAPADVIGPDGQMTTGFYVVEPYSGVIFG
jgi:hypothetical protein